MAKQTTSISRKSLLMTLCLAFFALLAACDKPQANKTVESAPLQTAATEETVNSGSLDTIFPDTKSIPIVDIAVNTNETLLATAQGKEIAIWDIKTGKRISTTQMPIEDDNGQEFFGHIYSIKFLPNQDLLAFAGAGSYIYLYDLKKKELILRLPTGLSVNIASICVSPDGQYLAATYMGVKIWLLSDQKRIIFDENYNNGIALSCDFSYKNNLITSTTDGSLHLYNLDNTSSKLIRTRRFDGLTIFKISLHQKTEKLAISYIKDGKFSLGIANMRNLTIDAEADGENINDIIFARGLTWSKDGEYLYAGGKYHDGNGSAPVFYWANGGLGKRNQIKGGRTYVQSVLTLSNGNIIVATADPAWLIQDQQGNLLLYKGQN